MRLSRFRDNLFLYALGQNWGDIGATKIKSLQPHRLKAQIWRRRDSNPRPEVLILALLRA